jgi:hypothetical protein
MNNLLRVNVVQWHTDHGKNSENLLFWDKLGFIALDNICKALVALFHDKTREFIFIFDKIFDLDNHRVIESS